MVSGSCNVLNGGCGEICVPGEIGRTCECDIGLQLQPDQSCDSGLYWYYISYCFNWNKQYAWLSQQTVDRYPKDQLLKT